MKIIFPPPLINTRLTKVITSIVLPDDSLPVRVQEPLAAVGNPPGDGFVHFTWPIEELEYFFNNRQLPSGAVRISVCEVITDLQFFVENSLTVIRMNDGRLAYYPYLLRLQKLKLILIN